MLTKLKIGDVVEDMNRIDKLSLFRFIFWNAGGLGWSIGKREYLQTGTHWHKSNAPKMHRKLEV